MVVVAHRDPKTFDLLHFIGGGLGLCGPDILKELIKIALGARIVVGALSFLDTVGQAVPTDPVQTLPCPHGILPAYLLSLGHFFPHPQIVFAGGAISKVITVLEFHHTRLHPNTGIGRLSAFIWFHHPNLAAQNRADSSLRSQILTTGLAI
jgi:hypothetical protein